MTRCANSSQIAQAELRLSSEEIFDAMDCGTCYLNNLTNTID